MGLAIAPSFFGVLSYPHAQIHAYRRSDKNG